MLDGIFDSLKELDSRLEAYVSEPVNVFGGQLAILFRTVPVPAAGDELRAVEAEIKQIKSDPKSLHKPAIITDPNSKPKDPPAVVRLNELYGKRRELMDVFLKDEKIRSFKKNLVYLLERMQDIILRVSPEHRDFKISYVDSALRQVETVCSPIGSTEPVVEHIDGVSRQFADPKLGEEPPMLQSEFQLKMAESSNGRRTGEIVKAGDK